MKLAVCSRTLSNDQSFIDKLENLDVVVRRNLAGTTLEGAELVEFLQDMDGAVIGLEELNADIIDQVNLSVVFKYGVGFDAVDLDALAKNEISFYIGQALNQNAVAELAVASMLNGCRLLPAQYRSTANRVWLPGGGVDLASRTVGVIGVGNIGSRVIHILESLGSRVVAYDIDVSKVKRYKSSPQVKVATSVLEVIECCDIVTLHTPLTSETRNLIDKNLARAFRKNSILINTARAHLISPEAIETFRIWRDDMQLFLDVFEGEPNIGALYTNENFFLTCHIGGSTQQAKQSMTDFVLNSIERYVSETG